MSNSDSSGDKTQPSWGVDDYWIIKIDSLGNKQWDKTFGGYDWDELSSIYQTSDNGYIIGGRSFSNATGDKTQPSWGWWDYWIVKTDSFGNKQWDRRFGGTGFDELHCLQQTNNGGYILGGQSNSIVSGDKTQGNWGSNNTYDYWIIKIDSVGDKQWDKVFGGIGDDQLYYLQQTTDGGYILGGFSESDSSGDKTQPSRGTRDYWIVKIDSLGIKQWDKGFSGIDMDLLYSLQQTVDGGYILGGSSYSGIGGDKTQPSWGGSDYWILKIDSLGNTQWDKDFGGSTWEDEYGNISLTADDGYLIAGTSYSNISGNKTENNLGPEQSWIIKTDSLGNKEWDKTIYTLTGHDETGLAIQTLDGCYAIANYTFAGIGGDKTQPNWDTTNQTVDYFIIKFCDTTATTSISNFQLLTSNFQIFPNPATETITLKWNKEQEEEQITINDLFGREVYHSSLVISHWSLVNGHSSITIDISYLSAGIYFIKAGNKVSKFVKE